MKVLVTGASGFIGRAIIERMCTDQQFQVHGTVRRPPVNKVADATYVELVDASPEMSWHGILNGIDLVIHTAARVHVMSDSAADPVAEYRRINVAGTMNLARQAADAGVSRFIFLSSIKVNGDTTQYEKPFHADDRPVPTCAYGKSKLEAEIALLKLSEASGMDVVVIRPPIVYGPGVRANFLTMMRWIHRGWPVPFGNIHNKRSLVALDNLVDLVLTCSAHCNAANQVFLVSDDEDVSTTELIKRIGIALQKPVRFWSIPTVLVRMLGTVSRRQGQVERLLGSLQVDIGKTCRMLNWKPVATMEEALHDTARYFLDSQQ